LAGTDSMRSMMDSAPSRVPPPGPRPPKNVLGSKLPFSRSVRSPPSRPRSRAMPDRLKFGPAIPPVIPGGNWIGGPF
jgi:hypothetical protein